MPLGPLYPTRTPLSPLWSPEPRPSSHRWADPLSQWPHPQEQCEGTLPELSTACGRLHQTGMSQQHWRRLLTHPGHHRWESAVGVGLWWCSELALLATNLLSVLTMLIHWMLQHCGWWYCYCSHFTDEKTEAHRCEESGLASNRAQKWPNQVHALNHSLLKELFLLLRQSLSVQNFLLFLRI